MYHQTNPPTVTTPKFRVRKPEDYVEEALILRTETALEDSCMGVQRT
jgi:hypothetical protein